MILNPPNGKFSVFCDFAVHHLRVNCDEMAGGRARRPVKRNC